MIFSHYHTQSMFVTFRLLHMFGEYTRIARPKMIISGREKDFSAKLNKTAWLFLKNQPCCPTLKKRNQHYGLLPSQLPAIGISPGLPKPKTISAKPIVLLFRSRNWALRYTPMVSMPSLFQSPVTGRSPPNP